MFPQLCTMEASFIPVLNQTMEMMAHLFYTLFGGDFMYYNILVDFRYVGTLSQVVLLKVQLVRLLVCLSADALVSLFHFSLVGEVEEGEGEAGGHQEHHVKPPVVEVELKIPQHRGDDCSVFSRHIHSHEHNHRHKVHSHYLGEEKHNDVGALGARDPYKEL